MINHFVFFQNIFYPKIWSPDITIYFVVKIFLVMIGANWDRKNNKGADSQLNINGFSNFHDRIMFENSLMSDGIKSIFLKSFVEIKKIKFLKSYFLRKILCAFSRQFQ